ncbi:hypothetical protein EVAR_9864_1 [Eumeta japonica]|uniref:ASCC3-like N-terminal domain-containing protein n=1 Tax=Eumeta variegata TaxID=151549 RepID=A0A4C1TQF6_EUMVA|nr:hypothetical protein EVAR_9864_1 [Eumeta japonica]
MIELPRITRALRAHTQLDKPRRLKPNTDVGQQNVITYEHIQRFKSWSDICDYIKQNENDPNCILILLNKLKETCQTLVGEGYTEQMLNDAAIYTLRMFLDQDIVMLKDLSKLRQMFGSVTSATANKICEIVVEIANEISEDTKAYIKLEILEDNKENLKLWGEFIECNHEPYRPIKKPLAKLAIKPATACNIVTDFSMKYDKITTTNIKTEITKPQRTLTISKVR